MQTYLADIQKLISDWYLLTSDNPWYGFTTAAIVWLLAAFLYNFKIFLLNKKKKEVELKLSEAQTKLEETELQLKVSEKSIAANADQLTEQKQLIEDFEAKNKNRNQKIIDSAKTLATKFGLSEQLDESDEEKQDEFIWQQQDSIIDQLSERIVSEQREKTALEAAHQQEIKKISEQESLTADLQTMLDRQTKQFTQMLTEQNSTLKQQTEKAQQHLSNILEKNKIRTTEPEVSDEPEDGLIPDLIGSVTFDTEDRDEPLNIKNFFGSEKVIETTPLSVDTDTIDTKEKIEESVAQAFDSPIQEESPKVMLPEEQDSEKEENFRELKKLLDESRQDHKTKMTTTLEKKPTVAPAPRKKKKVKSKSSFDLVTKMKGLFSKD